jgi:hypothetical protein
MAAPPKVSIITVTYNAAAVLEPTIESILAQTFTDYEYLIIDGGSKDATPDIIRRYADRLSYWVSEPDRGLYDAMNKGLRAARGEYVWFMNAGDRLYEADTLRKVFVDAPAGADVYYGDALFYEADGREVGLRSRVTPHPVARTAHLAVAAVRHGGVPPVVRAPAGHCPPVRPVAPLQLGRGLGDPLPARSPADGERARRAEPLPHGRLFQKTPPGIAAGPLPGAAETLRAGAQPPQSRLDYPARRPVRAAAAKGY